MKPGSARPACGRILVAVGNYPPGYGGAGLRVHNTYRRLRESLPLEIQAVTVGGRGDRAGCAEYDGVTIFETGARTGFWAQFTAIGGLLRQRGLRHFDIVHALGQSGVATAASTWALLLGIPLVRELTVNEPVSTSLGPAAFIRRLGFRRADLVIALNAGLKARLIEAGVDPGRIWERPNPVDTARFHPPSPEQRQAARRAFGLQETSPTHLLLGRLCPRKNQLFALEVLAQLPPEHRLLLLGPALQGDAPYVAAIAEQIAASGLEDRVIFRPRHIDNPLEAYHAADSCWIPSSSEGMPNVLLEAQVCGLPVVVNRALELEEHVTDGHNGFLCDLEAGTFATAAKRATEQLADEATRSRIAAAAAERYDARQLDREFEKRLRSLIAAQAAKAAPGNASAGAS